MIEGEAAAHSFTFHYVYIYMYNSFFVNSLDFYLHSTMFIFI